MLQSIQKHVIDLHQAKKLHSVRILSGGSLLSAAAFAASLSSSGAQFEAVVGTRGVILISGLIFVAALVGRLLKQEDDV